MKWRTPKHRETRTRTVFAWLPARCSDGTARWMERVIITEEYQLSRDRWDRIRTEAVRH